MSGQYRPGNTLDGEIEASDYLKVSRAAYREAVRILAAKGLVESRPKVGTRVTRRGQWHMLDPDVLSWIFDFEPDEELIASLFELRKIVEPPAAALAALRRTDYHLEAMSASLEAMKRHTLAATAGQVADQEFHAALLDATGNAFLVSLTGSVAAAVSWTTIFKQRSARPMRNAIPDHERVYVAIEKQDRPRDHRMKIHSTNPLGRLNSEIKRRTDVIVGIFPNEAVIVRPVGASVRRFWSGSG